MGLFGPKTKEYGDLNRQSITEIQQTTEEVKDEVKPFAGSVPGLVPESSDETQAKFLRGDGEWATPAGGSGGTSDYSELANKPAIDGTTLTKDSTAEDLGLAKKTDIPDTSDFVTDDDLKDYAKKTDIPSVPSKTSDLTNDSGFITGNDIPSIPSKTSQLTNDAGFISQESDPTVPSWAKQQNPPTPATFDGEHAGLVPAPASGDSGKYLKADGTWGTPESGGSSTVLKQTLTAGSTTVTFTNLPTTGDHVVSFYNSLGINYTEIAVDTGEVTLTYPEQVSNMAVYCEIKGV